MTDRYSKEIEDFLKVAELSSSSTDREHVEPPKLVERAMRSLRTAVTSKNPDKVLVRALAKPLLESVFEDQPLQKVSSADVTPIQLYTLLNTKYGKDWYDWEPETLQAELGASDPAIKDMLHALQLVVSTDFVHEHWHIFENVGQAFNGSEASFTMIQPLELDEVARTLSILKKIRPNRVPDQEIFGYIAAVAKNSGVVYLPEEYFGDSQKYLDEINNDLELKAKVATMWPQISSGSYSISKVPTDIGNLPLKIQLLRLLEIKDYLGNA